MVPTRICIVFYGCLPLLQPSVHHWGIFLLQKKYRQDVSALKFTSVEDTPEMIQAKLSNKLAIDVSSADVCST